MPFPDEETAEGAPADITALGWIFAAGGAAAGAMVPFLHPAYRWSWLVGIIVVGLALAAAAVRAAHKLPAAGQHLLFAYASVAICAANLLGGARTAPFLAFYAWVVAYAAYYFSPRAFVGHAVGIAAGVFVGSLPVPDDQRVATLIPQIATLCFITLVVRRLRRRHRSEVAALTAEAHSDALTGALNRRAFEGMLSADVRTALARGRPISLILGDIDHFKRINDEHGHPAGDACLVEIGRCLSEHVRGSDYLFRIGGEEFAIVLHGTGEAGAARLAEELRRAVADCPMPHGGAVRMSFGVASIPEHARGRSSLYRAADAALYRAKEQGRDRCCLAPPLDGVRQEPPPSRRSGSFSGPLA